MSNHTPGPWRIGDAGFTVFGPKTTAPSPKIVATCLSREDARLVCFAPELLKVLQQALHDVCCLNMATTEEAPALNEALQKRLRAILYQVEKK